MLACKEWRGNSDNCYLFKYNQPKAEIPLSIYKMGGPSVNLPLISCLFIMSFNFGYVYILNSGFKQINILKIVLISWQNCSSFMNVWMSMYDTEGNRDHICIRDHFFNCRQPHQHLPEREETSINN